MFTFFIDQPYLFNNNVNYHKKNCISVNSNNVWSQFFSYKNYTALPRRFWLLKHSNPKNTRNLTIKFIYSYKLCKLFGTAKLPTYKQTSINCF